MMSIEEKDKKIKLEMKRLKKLFADNDVDEQTCKVLEKTISNVSFMAIMLEDLQSEINERGYIEEYKNGKDQHCFKDSAAVRTYNNTIKSYTVLLKTLASFLPNNSAKKAATGANLGTFLMK